MAVAATTIERKTSVRRTKLRPRTKANTIGSHAFIDDDQHRARTLAREVPSERLEALLALEPAGKRAHAACAKTQPEHRRGGDEQQCPQEGEADRRPLHHSPDDCSPEAALARLGAPHVAPEPGHAERIHPVAEEAE